MAAGIHDAGRRSTRRSFLKIEAGTGMSRVSESSFEVLMPAISRRLEVNGGDGVFLLVKVPGGKGSPAELMADVDVAIARANTALDRGDDVDVVWAASAMPSVKGPMINLDWVGSEEQNHEWLDVFAESMQTAGYTGTVTAAPQANLPQYVNSYFTHSRPTAYLAYTLTDPLPPHGPPSWHVNNTTTAAICKAAVAWGAFAGADVYLSEGVAQVRVEKPDLSEELATAVWRSWMARVAYLANKPTRSRVVTLYPNGQAAYQAGGDNTEWADDVGLVRHALLRAPESLDIGYVRRRNGFGTSLMDLGGDPYKLKYIEEVHVRYNRHLWAQYAPDPNGIQVLTKSHLDKATNLSNWDVTALPGDRYLVQARELRPWFAHDVPDQEVIDAARTDFGAMLLTLEVIEADPNGWVPGRPLRIAPD